MYLNTANFDFLAKCLEGFFFGIYSGVFIMYLQYYGSKKGASKGNNTLFYALCLLYLLSVVSIVVDLAIFFIPQTLTLTWWNHLPSILYPLDVIQTTLFAFCDLTAQMILIYRCWIVWGYNIRIVIVPAVLAFTFLPIWIAAGAAPVYLVEDQMLAPAWSGTLTITGLVFSMIVNALVMGLIVLKIFKVLREVKATSDNRMLGATGRRKLRPILFVLIESGMTLFSIQLVRLVVIKLFVPWRVDTPGADNAYPFVAAIHGMFNGITPTIILVRVSMGFSFHDENSMVEASIESLRFVPTNDLNPIPETEGKDQETGDGDLGTGLHDDSDIQMIN